LLRAKIIATGSYVPKHVLTNFDLEKMVEDLERTLLMKALDKTKGIKKKAAELLHINFRSMRYRLEKYGLNHGADSELG